MAERREETSVAPRRSLAGGTTSTEDGPVLPPMPKPAKPKQGKSKRDWRRKGAGATGAGDATGSAEKAEPTSGEEETQALQRSELAGIGMEQARTTPAERPKRPAPRRPRKARLRLVQVDPWSVTKTAFLLSIALGVVSVVAVGIVWTVLGASGLWESVNSTVQEALGDSSSAPFQIQDYLGTSRVLGFTMIVSVVDVVLLTMIATLGAFLYNLAATLLGGVEVTLAEDD